MLVTDYQFISVVLSIDDNAAARIWWRHHIYPSGPEKKYFDEWRNFLINKIIQNKIKVIYTIKPLEGEENILQNIISDQCYTENNLSKILMIQEMMECNELISSINLK